MKSGFHEPLGGFSRGAFERSADPDELGAALAAALLPRLRSAASPLSEAHAIIEDLRRSGHNLWSWDESDDCSVWGDDYVTPPFRTRFLIEMRWPSFDDPTCAFEVAVTFGPWPRAADA